MLLSPLFDNGRSAVDTCLIRSGKYTFYNIHSLLHCFISMSITHPHFFVSCPLTPGKDYFNAYKGQGTSLIVEWCNGIVHQMSQYEMSESMEE